MQWSLNKNREKKKEKTESQAEKMPMKVYSVALWQSIPSSPTITGLSSLCLVLSCPGQNKKNLVIKMQKIKNKIKIYIVKT